MKDRCIHGVWAADYCYECGDALIDSAIDGPEVAVINFFQMYPDGLESRFLSLSIRAEELRCALNS